MKYISIFVGMVLCCFSSAFAVEPDQPDCMAAAKLGPPPASLSGSCGVRVVASAIEGAIVSGDTIYPIGNGVVKFPIEFSNTYPNSFTVTTSLAVYSPDGGHWKHATANGGNYKSLPATMTGIWVDTTGFVGKDQFGGLYKFNLFGADGVGEDTVIFGGAANDISQTAWPGNTTGVFFKVILHLSTDDVGKHICIDSTTNFPPTCTAFRWSSFNVVPSFSVPVGWNGPYCFVIGGCCRGLTGNYDCDPEDRCDISDITAFIDRWTTLQLPCCPGEANTDGSPDGISDISDLTALIDYLYISFTPPAPCR